MRDPSRCGAVGALYPLPALRKAVRFVIVAKRLFVLSAYLKKNKKKWKGQPRIEVGRVAMAQDAAVHLESPTLRQCRGYYPHPIAFRGDSAIDDLRWCVVTKQDTAALSSMSSVWSWETLKQIRISCLAPL